MTTTTATKTATLSITPIIFDDRTKGTRYEVWEHGNWSRVGVGYDQGSAVSMAEEEGYSVTAVRRN